MAYSVNAKIAGMKPYSPISVKYRIRLDANESFIAPPPEIAKRISEAAASVQFNRYPDPYAGELCHAFAGYYGIPDENVVAGNGSDELISLFESSFLMKGETLVTLSPDFSMYRFYSGLNETNCCEFKKNNDFTVDVGRLIDTVNEKKARMVIFSNPCNPTSLGLKREEIRRLLKSVDALVVLDEAYMDFWDQSLLSEVNDYDNLVILRTCSKAMGLAGIRLGFAVTDYRIADLLRAVKSPYNVNAVTQRIGAAVLSETDWLKNCRKNIIASKNSLYNLLKPLEPEGVKAMDGVTNFVTVRLKNGVQIWNELLKRGIAVRCFGDFLRITAGTDEENRAVAKALAAAVQAD